LGKGSKRVEKKAGFDHRKKKKLPVDSEIKNKGGGIEGKE